MRLTLAVVGIVSLTTHVSVASASQHKADILNTAATLASIQTQSEFNIVPAQLEVNVLPSKEINSFVLNQNQNNYSISTVPAIPQYVVNIKHGEFTRVPQQFEFQPPTFWQAKAKN